MKELWVSKYSPKNLNEYTFTSPHLKSMVREFVVEKSIPHLLLTGDPGTGKSTLAELLIEACGIEPSDVLIIDGTKDNSVDVMRDRVINFVITSGFGEMKVVLIEEADRLSTASQDVLREVMVRYSNDARFILTGNNSHKITPALKSRCGETISFTTLPYAQVLKRVLFILESECVEFDLSDVEAIITSKMPDMRAVINTLQHRTVKGKLLSGPLSDQTSDLIHSFLDSQYSSMLTHATNMTPSEVVTCYSDIFNALLEHPTFSTTPIKFDNAVIAIAQYQYQHSFSADVTICLAALIAQLRIIDTN